MKFLFYMYLRFNGYLVVYTFCKILFPWNFLFMLYHRFNEYLVIYNFCKILFPWNFLFMLYHRLNEYLVVYTFCKYYSHEISFLSSTTDSMNTWSWILFCKIVFSWNFLWYFVLMLSTSRLFVLSLSDLLYFLNIFVVPYLENAWYCMCNFYLSIQLSKILLF